MPKRFRSRNQPPTIEPTTVVVRYSDWSGVDTRSTSHGQVYGVTVVDEMSDTVTPGYVRLRKKGIIINNPYSQVRSVVQEGSVPFKATYQSDHWRMEDGELKNFWNRTEYSGQHAWSNINYWARTAPNASVDIDSLKRQAITKLYAKLASSEVQAWVAIAERKKTLQTITSVLGRAIKIVKAIKRADLAAIRGELSPEQLRKRYLEARYGLRPLVYDITGAIRALSKPTRPLRQRFSATTSDSAQGQDQATVTPGSFYQGWWPTFRVDATKSVGVRVSAGALVEYSASELQGVSDWGLSQILSTGWELIPYSFIIDWFCNIGQLVASWEPFAAGKVLTSWVVVEETTVSTRTCSFLDEASSGGGSQISQARNKAREINPARPILPAVKINLNTWKVLDLVAILIGLKGK